MGFRFRRSVRIAPGLRLNLSKSGGSVSVGRRGATVNLSGRGTRTTVGLPGTGISYSSTTSSRRSSRQPGGIVNLITGLGVLVLLGAVAWHLIFG